jgi:hypothetical protein
MILPFLISPFYDVSFSVFFSASLHRGHSKTKKIETSAEEDSAVSYSNGISGEIVSQSFLG